MALDLLPQDKREAGDGPPDAPRSNGSITQREDTGSWRRTCALGLWREDGTYRPKPLAPQRTREEPRRPHVECLWGTSERTRQEKGAVRFHGYLGDLEVSGSERVFGQSNLLYIWSSKLISA